MASGNRFSCIRRFHHGLGSPYAAENYGLLFHTIKTLGIKPFFSSQSSKEAMAEKITNGEYRGFYTIPDSIMRESLREDAINAEPDLWRAYKQMQQQLEGERAVYYRFKPRRPIRGFNRSYLPRIDGYYYVRRNPQIDLRRLLYALETNRIPSDGNVELFERQLSEVRVPKGWCPLELDPCVPSDICCDLADMQPRAEESMSMTLRLILLIMRWTLLTLLATMLAFILATIS